MLAIMDMDVAQIADALHATDDDAPSVKQRYLADVARPVRVIDSRRQVGELEVVFRDEALDVVAVAREHADDVRADRVGTRTGASEIGLLTRRRYNSALTGRLGYGRAVHTRRKVSEIADWEPLVLLPQTSIADAATRAMRRSADRRYDYILITDTQWAVADFGDVTKAMVSTLARRSTRDPLTGMPVRASILHELQRRCRRAAGGRARIALILIKIDGLQRINARHGQKGGDVVLEATGHKLLAQRIAGQEIARVSGATFAVVAALPPTDELQVAATVDHLRKQFLAGLVVSPQHIPAAVWPSFSSGVAWTDQAVVDADGLVRVAESRLRADQNASVK